MLEPIGANFGQTFGICTGMFTDSQTYNDAQILSLNYQASKIICSLPTLVRTFDVNLSLSTNRKARHVHISRDNTYDMNVNVHKITNYQLVNLSTS